MNKLTKIGCSALCGSLAAISAANAGELTVTGGVDMSWVSVGDTTTGNPIGMGSNLTFKGDGELDNGWTFSLAVANTNAQALSAAVVTINTNSLGSFVFNHGDSTSGIQAFDDKTPSAWEEPWGTGLSTGIDLVSGAGTSASIMWKSPTVLGVSLTGTYVPDMGAVDTADKTAGTSADNNGRGYDVTVNINPSLGTEVLSGLNIFAAGHSSEQYWAAGTSNNDHYEASAGITYAIGPVSLGFQRTGELTGNTTTATNVDGYRNNMYGVSFNINDDLSVSWGKTESEKNFVNPGNSEAVTLEVESYQIAYTIGGASIRFADADGSNLTYSTAAGKDSSGQTLSVSLAF